MKQSELLVRFRKKMKMTQVEVAEYLELEQGTVSKVERDILPINSRTLWDLIDEVLEGSLSAQLEKKLPPIKNARQKNQHLLKSKI